MGSLFNVPIATTNRENAVNWLRGIDAQIIVTTPGGRDLYSNINLTETTAVVVGNESEGLDEFWLNAGTNTRIPMAGEADSLNVSITAAVTLFEAQRQRNVLQG